MNPTQYPSDDSDFACTITDAKLRNIETETNAEKIIIHYEGTYTGADLVAGEEIEINCIYWRNPITPKIQDGYLLATLDLNGA